MVGTRIVARRTGRERGTIEVVRSEKVPLSKKKKPRAMEME